MVMRRQLSAKGVALGFYQPLASNSASNQFGFYEVTPDGKDPARSGGAAGEPVRHCFVEFCAGVEEASQTSRWVVAPAFPSGPYPAVLIQAPQRRTVFSPG
jgi:hypothetical protein